MTSILERESVSQHVQAQRTDASRLPSANRGRRPIVIVGSLVMVFSSIAIFADIYSSANRQTSVLISAVPIEQGQQLTGGELGQVSISVSGGSESDPGGRCSKSVGQARRRNDSRRKSSDSRRRDQCSADCCRRCGGRHRGRKRGNCHQRVSSPEMR